LFQAVIQSQLSVKGDKVKEKQEVKNNLDVKSIRSAGILLRLSGVSQVFQLSAND